MNPDTSMIPCYGCKAVFAEFTGPSHAYIGSSVGCWASYGELQVKEYEAFGIPAPQRLSVHIYAAQHPGVPSPQAIQSVAVHLIVLYLVLERGFPTERATQLIQKILHQRGNFTWLDPPASLGPVTIADVLLSKGREEHQSKVMLWARSVWQAWSAHHAMIRKWAHQANLFD